MARRFFTHEDEQDDESSIHNETPIDRPAPEDFFDLQPTQNVLPDYDASEYREVGSHPAVQEQRLALPELPGIYKYFDKNEKIIYVGKARNLRRRVNSYFTKSHPDLKTRQLVANIRRIEYVVTESEYEALLLENNLIKENQPRYNIALRDGKTYPYISIENERFPRIHATRNRERNGSTYYGPYPSVHTMNTLLRFIRDNFKIRTCSLNLSAKNIEAGKYRPCLEYHIGKCKAPCVNKQDEAEYNEDIRQIRAILKGSFKAVIDHLTTEMQQAVSELRFEDAHFLKTRIEHIQKQRRKSVVVSESITDIEVVTIMTLEDLSVVNHFKVVNGTITQTHAYDIRLKNGEPEPEVLSAVLSRLIAEDDNFFKDIYTNIQPADDELSRNFKIHIPTRGDQLKIVQLSLRNCEVLLDEKINLSRIKKKEPPFERALMQLQKDLRLERMPYHIECFDNSNIQGYAPVSSVVVFKNGKPAKRDYRVFNVKTVEGINDFATMKEAVSRRYKRMMDEKKPLPDLVVIDGGKGQLSSAVEALVELGIMGQLPIVSIAKRLEEIFYPGDPVPLYIDKKSQSLRLLQRIRNEAHDTAINYHRKKRDEKTLRSQLYAIKGVGKETAKKLLSTFKSMDGIRKADLPQLAKVVGMARAMQIHEFFHAPSTDT